jgi:uncharacterized flavoprotein (TIGR03862 family)
MAASLLAERADPGSLELTVFERRPSFGRKLLIAGSSGLNISHDLPIEAFIGHYQGFTPEFWGRLLKSFSPSDWIRFVEGLGFETFVGTSSRYFVREMKASGLLKAWTEKLKASGVTFIPNHEWQSKSELSSYDAVGFFLGGGSWEDRYPTWPEAFHRELQVETHPFVPANVGYEVNWSQGFITEAEGKPLKNIVFKSALGEKAGELIVTRYGLEGTPIYFYGATGTACLDLKPGLTRDEIKSKLSSIKENLAPLRRIKKALQLCEASLALLFHEASPTDHAQLDRMIDLIKAFPIKLTGPRPLLEAISSRGGVDLGEIHTEPNQEFMLKKHPGLFCGGEMLDWTAPTGGFLIQAAVTQGAVVAKNILTFLHRPKTD